MQSIILQQLEETTQKNKPIYYIGNLALLERVGVAIIGSRKPNGYAKNQTTLLASALAEVGCCVISGGAIGTDALAHKGAGAENTIMVSATGLDVRYPSINKNLIAAIEQNGLVLSQFPPKTPSLRYHFPMRNELIVALAKVVVVPYADENSGSMRSIEYALKMKKEIYVLPHRLGESVATNKLIQEQKAKVIFDIDAFVGMFGERKAVLEDELLAFVQNPKPYDEVLSRFGQKVFEYELLGKITIQNGMVTA